MSSTSHKSRAVVCQRFSTSFLLMIVLCAWSQFLPPAAAQNYDKKISEPPSQPRPAPAIAWPGPDPYNYHGYLTTGGFEDIINTGTYINFADEDDGASNIPIGFTFPFYGSNFTSVYVSVNGAISFQASSIGYANQEIPYASPQMLIAPMWDDWSINYGGWLDISVKYEVNGTAPNRRTCQSHLL